MSAINPDEIISILKEEIENYDEISQNQEVGTVISVGDGIATVYGIDHAMYGEVVVFENGLKGMVQDIRTNSMGCILFGKDTGIKEGTKVTRTGKQAGIPVGNGYVGRIVNALGAPIDGKGEIKEEGYRPVENPAPGIIDRKSVTVPLETGILSLDSMFPIGRGQRELIICDRQTAKTSIATDTIINKKLVTASNIFRFTMSTDVQAIKCLTGSEAEVLEFIVKPNAPATKAPIKELKLPQDTIIGGVVRGDKVFIAVGNMELSAYDRVVVFAMPASISKIGYFFN